MKLILLVMALVACLPPAARAQQPADEKFVEIYSALEQARTEADNGESKQALMDLISAQSQLQQFQKSYPDWNPNIISYRLEDLAKRIADLRAKLAAPPAASAAAESTNQAPQMTAQEAGLQAQLQSMQQQNQTLQAKLKEALSAAPAAPDVGELARAQEQIRSLMKETDLLKARAGLDQNSNQIPVLRQQLSKALDESSAEQAQVQKLTDANAALQRDLKNHGEKSAGAPDLTAELKAANQQISSLQSALNTAGQEKSDLAAKVKQLSDDLEKVHSANYDGQIRDLTEQRDKLAKQLAKETKISRKKGGEQAAALAEENESLRARLAVDEAKAVPFSTEELALLKQAPPQPAPARHSIHELPPGAADLVASAQQHFSRHEYDAAEADYRKILESAPSNSLVLGNLAMIELQENKLADAERHITSALTDSPDDAYNLATLGIVKYRRDQYDDALNILSRAAGMDPKNPEIQNYLGLVLSQKGLRKQAEAALRTALEIDPTYAPAHNNLAVIYLNDTPPSPLLARWHYQKAIAAGQARNPDFEKLLAEKGAPIDGQ
jgi:Tfp pilus assembly protein PilF